MSITRILDGQQFALAVKAADQGRDKKWTLPTLTGFLLEARPDGIAIITTDRYVLACVTVGSRPAEGGPAAPAPHPSEAAEVATLVDATALLAFVKTLPSARAKGAPVQVMVTWTESGLVTASTATTTMGLPSLDGQFPQWRNFVRTTVEPEVPGVVHYTPGILARAVAAAAHIGDVMTVLPGGTTDRKDWNGKVTGKSSRPTMLLAGVPADGLALAMVVMPVNLNDASSEHAWVAA